MTIFIGISGKRGSGKDTCCKIIQEYMRNLNYTFKQAAFADEVKRVYAIEMGVDFKRLLMDYKYKAEHRPGLIEIGNREKKIHGKDIWCYRLFEKFGKTVDDAVLITDLRYPNEAKSITNSGYKYLLIRIDIDLNIREERGIKYDSDIDQYHSEVSLDDSDIFDLRVDNNGSVKELKKKILDFIKQKLMKPSA